MSNEYKRRTKEVVSLCHMGVGGQKGLVYHAYGICPAETATQYKDPHKVIVIHGK